jgi:hypothetical protein
MLNLIWHSPPEDYAVYRTEPYVAADVYSLESQMGRRGWTWYPGSRPLNLHTPSWRVRADHNRRIQGLFIQSYPHGRLTPCQPKPHPPTLRVTLR